MQFILNDFIPEHTFDCGQAFRWEKQPDESWLGIAGKRAARISAEGKVVTIAGASEEDFDAFWKNYLDCGRDYGKIKDALSVNPVMERAITYGSGIRILKQEFHEALISFIISQRSSIARIKTCVKRLCENFGEKIEFEGKTLFTFPDTDALKRISERDFALLGTGYRAPYLYEAAQKLFYGILNGEELEQLPAKEAREKLLSVRGVGDKVCDCVLLFSLGKYDIFPSDVWIKRAMAEYFNTENAKEDGEKLFGRYSGFAQQYLFYWKKNA